MFLIKQRRRKILATGLFVSGVFALLASSTLLGVDEKFKVAHAARALQPGEVVLMSVDANRPLKELTATSSDRKFSFYSDGESAHWVGLVGIDLETPPGDVQIQLNGKNLEGELVESKYQITILDKQFPTRQLSVDSKYVSPPQDELDRIAQESQRVSRIFATTTPERFWRGPFLRPVPGEARSSFGKRSVYNGQPRSPHTGTDFKATKGAPIKAPNNGRVVLVKDLYFAGNTVIIDHGLGLYSYFAHLSEFRVEEGETVKTGQVIGLVGATGRVTGPHLHWTVRLSKARVDPLSLMNVLETAGGS
ncbi:MAG TPA: M23 family metallopeptidase [Acidobacteriota bacterium]|nr:M23 family metallopeptidase [Acidobacteriota bacterium]